MTAQIPHVLLGPRRLADVARPAGGRAHQRRTHLRAAPCELSTPTAHWMAAQLRAEVGPALAGAVVVEVLRSHEAAAAALGHPNFAREPVERLTAALAGYDAVQATLGHAVLLVAHCLVLWPQTQTCSTWHLS